MPRVGSTVNASAPLLTSTTSTPSRRPPRSVRLRTDHGSGVAKRSVSLLTPNWSSQTSPTTSVSTHCRARVMIAFPSFLIRLAGRQLAQQRLLRLRRERPQTAVRRHELHDARVVAAE